MTRLYVFVEGKTEKEFVVRVLRDHLFRYGVLVQGAIEISHAMRRGIVHRGGGGRYGPMAKDIRNQCKSDRARDAAFTTMIDLYRIAKDFPGLLATTRLRWPKRVAVLESRLAEDIADTRFHPYIQVHEFEAVLLSHPEALFETIQANDRDRRTFLKSIKRFPTPEDIDSKHGPSARILSAFPKYEKALHGVLVAKRIGLETIRAKCHHFNQWLTKLESLGPSPASAA